MEKEIIIKIEKIKIIGYCASLLLRILLFSFVVWGYFFGSVFTEEPPLILIIISCILIPILLVCLVFYFIKLFDDKPVLVINEMGIEVRLFDYVEGVIKWEDIKDSIVIPYKF